ncbi:glycosyltransferase [uncultured Desulfobacter sp.]|uniref:glycosyltransferase n=1 Tax=uncultured Desulfobacter sp. TaxID=240139 RepID=UPI0029F56AB3|nr:glycosyltransferase [uncultured Desulfobacter sp.]
MSQLFNIMTHKISIILPNLNHLRFLPDRIGSITSQTFIDWECIVIDGFSDDGSWEYLKKIADSDNRFRLYREPPIGPYNAWNKGISRAKGKYVYIATSDDTMEPTCIEKMYDALERHTQCQIAHCCLTIIDEGGANHPIQWNKGGVATFFGDLINKSHIRYTPHDVFVHGGWSTVFRSITQILIKKDLFETTGLFRENLGSVADFEWGVRAALMANIIHIPEYLATWRKYPEQLTDAKYIASDKFSSLLCDMVEMAYEKVGHIKNEISASDVKKIMYVYRRQLLSRSYKQMSLMKYLFLILNHFKDHRQATFDFIISVITFKQCKRLNIEHYIRSLLANYDGGKQLIEILKN